MKKVVEEVHRDDSQEDQERILKGLEKVVKEGLDLNMMRALVEARSER